MSASLKYAIEVACRIPAQTYLAFEPIGKFHMLSREKGHLSGSRPAAAEDSPLPGEPRPGTCCRKPPSTRAPSVPATRNPVSTRAKRILRGCPSRFSEAPNEARLRGVESGEIQTTGGRGGNPRVTISQVGNAYHKCLLAYETALGRTLYLACPATALRHLFCCLLEPRADNPNGR